MMALYQVGYFFFIYSLYIYIYIYIYMFISSVYWLSSLKHNNLILELENKVIMEFKQVLYGIRL